MYPEVSQNDVVLHCLSKLCGEPYGLLDAEAAQRWIEEEVLEPKKNGKWLG